jgi:anti-anti-sigma factor
MGVLVARSCFVSPAGRSCGGTADGRGVLLRAQQHDEATIVAVSGDIDAWDAARISAYVGGLIATGHPLVLDVTDVDFLAVAGLRALMRIAAECVRAGLEWALVTNDAMNALWRVADRNHRLPARRSVDEALERLTASTGAPWPLRPVTARHLMRC